MHEYSDIYRFWFEETDPKEHFMGGPDMDTQIHRRFSELYDTMIAQTDPTLEAGTEAVLATIIMFDQFSRSMFRGHAQAFATDMRALSMARALVEAGADKPLSMQERMFTYLPFEHSEKLADQDVSVRLYEALATDFNDAPDIESALDYAYRHRQTILRFGRFPGRNKALGRNSTKEELAFLQEHPAGF